MKEEEVSPVRFCRLCGKEFLNPNAKFCSKCGTAVKGNLSTSNPIARSPDTSNVAGNTNNLQPTVQNSQNQIPNQYLSSVQNQNNPQVANNFFQEPKSPSPSPYLFSLNESSKGSNDYKVMGQIIIILFITHMMKIFLLYNRFPKILELVYAIPIYVTIVIFVYFINLSFYNKKGIFINHLSDRYLFSQSLVLTSFFMTIIPFKISTDIDKSVIPESVSIEVKQKGFLGYQDIPRLTYINHYVRQRYIFTLTVIMLILSIIFLILYLQVEDDILKVTFRITITFFAGMVVSESMPIFGRNNKMMGSLYKYRTFLVFLIGFIIFIIGIFSEIFLSTILDTF